MRNKETINVVRLRTQITMGFHDHTAKFIREVRVENDPQATGAPGVFRPENT